MKAIRSSGDAKLPARRPARAVVGTMLAGAMLLGACSAGARTASPTSTTANHPTGSSPTTGNPTSVTAAPETNVPGDIPDTTAYVPYANAGGGYAFSHPEGWAQTVQGTSASFTDKYNGVSADVLVAAGPPTAAGVRASEVPALQASEPAFALVSVTDTSLPAGAGVLIIYRRNSPPNPVTGSSVRQEVHRYEIFARGGGVVLSLFGAVGADNVDPYTRMSQSLRLS